MNTEKKLEYFAQAVAREVETKKRHARQQMAADMAAEVAQAVGQAQAGINEQIQAERHAIEKAGNKRITEAAIEARRALAALREQLTDELFDSIKTDLLAFTQSPEYESFLIKNATKAQADNSYTFIRLTPCDMRFGSAIQEATGLIPEEGETAMLGGFKLLSENRSKAQEHTIAISLANARQEFSTNLSKLLSN